MFAKHKILMGLVFHFLILSKIALAANTTEWKGRSIYQVFTDRFARTDGSTTAACNTTLGLFCGGTWRGVINHLDYIQDMGFDSIMISPVSKNVEGQVEYGEAYHGYWPVDLYELNEHFGTRQDLLDLGTALHSRNMYLMVDIVINNMAFITNGSDPATDVDYSVFTPFNNADYFHPYCEISNYNNYTLAQNCWTGDDIVPLPDLYTEHPDVTSMMEKWVKEFVSNYSVDGLRIDAAKHVTLPYLKSVGDAAGVYATGEVLEGNAYVACNYQNYIPSVPNYPIYFSMIDAFADGNTSSLSDAIVLTRDVCPDVTALASFSENHDNVRFPSYTKDMALAKNVIAFTILADGVPMLYQGQEQHFSGGVTPGNREALWLSGYDTTAPLYQLTTILNKIRQQAIRIDDDYLSTTSYPIYTDGSTIAVRKGQEGRQVIAVYSTQGEPGGDYILTLPVTYQIGLTVTEVVSCTNYTIDESGELKIQMGKGEPKVLFPANQMGGSGLCGVGNWTVKGSARGNNAKSAADGGMHSRVYSTFSLGVLASVIAGVFLGGMI